MNYTTLVGGSSAGRLSATPWYDRALHRGAETYEPRRFLLPDGTIGERWVCSSTSRPEAARAVSAQWLAGTRW
ncbi:hypothetical protein Acf1_00060 [Acidovorax phage ACF1]|nr:hypothetical protein Acf1_00060 [Acidovorax phage ACF1]